MLTSQHAIMKQIYDKSEIQETKKAETVACQFRNGLKKLMDSLHSKSASHVRCIKPNAHKSASRFEDDPVKNQVTYLSLVDITRIRRAGYAYKAKYELFAKRFFCLCPTTRFDMYKHHGTARTASAQILIRLGYSESNDFKLGK